MRVASVRLAELDVVRCPAALEAARRAERTAAQLAVRREARCDRIHRLVPGQPSVADRSRLLELKRAVHNDRAVAVTVDVALGDSDRADLERWQLDARRAAEELETGDRIVREWHGELAGLCALWAIEPIRRGVLHAAPALHDILDFGLASPSADVRLRSAEALLTYAFRAATKTSPFSSFTVTGIGRLRDGIEELSQPAVGRPRSRLVIEPWIVQALARRWLSEPILADRAPLRTPALLAFGEHQIVFLTGVAADADTSTVEMLRTVERSPLLEVGLRVASEAHPDRSACALRRRLARTLGCDEARAGRVVETMLECGLLEVQVAHCLSRPGALRQLADAVTELADGEHQDATRALTAVRALERSATEAVAANVGLIRHAVAELRTLAGAPPMDSLADAVFDRCWSPTPVDVPARALTPLATQLARLLDLLPLCNADLGAERVVQEHLAQWCTGGAVVSLTDAFRYVAVPLASADGHAAVVAADVLRAQLANELRALAEQEGATRVEVPPALLTGWSDRAARFAPGRTGLGALFLGQLTQAPGDEGLGFALNGVAAGHGTLLAAWARSEGADGASRWLHERLRRDLEALDKDAEVVELVGALGFGTQVRDPLTSTGLHYPIDPPADEPRIDLRDLGVRYDDELQRVVLVRRTDDRRVLPIHLGAISPHLMPALYRFLTALGPAFTPDLPLIELMESTVGERRRDSLRHYARLQVGRVALLRETWCIPSADVPRPTQRRLSFRDFLALRRWAHELDLPRRVFVTAVQSADLVRGSLDLRRHRTARKPFYLDFDDIASCALLSRLLRFQGPTVRIAEMHPIPDENPFQHTVECGLELRRRRDT